MVLVALGIVAILGLGAVAVLHFTDRSSQADPGPSAPLAGSRTPAGGPGTPSDGPSSPTDPEALARTQASAVDSLLVTAMASRSTLTAALNEADSCGNLSTRAASSPRWSTTAPSRYSSPASWRSVR